MLIIDGIHTQEHEDDRLRAADQHFHGVLDGCVRFRRYVAFNIVLHGDATKVILRDHIKMMESQQWKT